MFLPSVCGMPFAGNWVTKNQGYVHKDSSNLSPNFCINQEIRAFSFGKRPTRGLRIRGNDMLAYYKLSSRINQDRAPRPLSPEEGSRNLRTAPGAEYLRGPGQERHSPYRNLAGPTG